MGAARWTKARMAELRLAEGAAAFEAALARGDVTAVARYFEFYAGAADKLMGETIPFYNGHTVFTLHLPMHMSAAADENPPPDAAAEGGPAA